MEVVDSINVRDEITDLLKELNLNIDVDVALLAGQTPPIKLFPTPNTSHLPYNEQLSILETEYQKHYTYRGDLKYHEKMRRSIGNKGKDKNTKDDETCMYRIFRDRNRFFETRIKDDVLILGKILESMVERTAEMQKHLEQVLLDAGETELPNWDELFEENIASGVNSNQQLETKCAVKGSKIALNSKKPKEPIAIEQNSNAASDQKNDHIQQNMTPEQAQMLVAQMMLARSLSHSNRIHVN